MGEGTDPPTSRDGSGSSGPEGWEFEASAFVGELSRDEIRIGAVVAVGLGLQMVLFLSSVMPLTDAPFDADAARTYAALGLAGTLVPVGVMVHLLRKGLVRRGRSLAVAFLGAALGIVAAGEIPKLVGDTFLAPDIDAPLVYAMFVVPAILGVSLFAFVGASMAKSRDEERWRDWAAAPLFLWTAFHAELLYYVWSQAPTLAADAQGSWEGGLFLVLVEGTKILPWLPV